MAGTANSGPDSGGSWNPDPVSAAQSAQNDAVVAAILGNSGGGGGGGGLTPDEQLHAVDEAATQLQPGDHVVSGGDLNNGGGASADSTVNSSGADSGTAADSTTEASPLDALIGPIVGLITAIVSILTGDPARPGSHGLSFLFLPTTWVRILAGIAGAILLFIGIMALMREVKSDG